jgi:hypothetical protein
MKVLVIITVIVVGGPRPDKQAQVWPHAVVHLGRYVDRTGPRGKATFRVSPGRYRLHVEACPGTYTSTDRTLNVHRAERVRVLCYVK